MWLSRYFVIFILYSIVGWIFESTYCTIKEGKWCNRGFLYGPIVPIYGAGAVGLTIVVDLLSSHYSFHPVWWETFIISYLGSVVLEFGTSWVLEKLFHAVWWDYSNMPLNIQGRVCVPCSIGFGVAGLIVTYGFYPLMDDVVRPGNSILTELVSLLMMFLMAADCALTVSALTGLQKNVVSMEDSLNRQMESFVDMVKERGESVEEHVAANRERLSRQYAEHVVTQMSGMQQKALQRVKSFRPARPEFKGSLHLKNVVRAIEGLKDRAEKH